MLRIQVGEIRNKSEIYTNSSRTEYKLLKSLPYIASKSTSVPKPNLNTFADAFSVPMIEIWRLEIQEYITLTRFFAGGPAGYYGEYIADYTSQAALALNLNYTVAEKEKLLIGILQYGLDMYGTLKGFSNDSLINWKGGGGHGHGRKLPIMLAGEIFQDQEIRYIWNRTGEYMYSSGHSAGNLTSAYIHFGEDDQTFYLTQNEVNIPTRTENCGGETCTYGGYSSDMLGLPEWAISHSIEPLKGSEWSNPNKPNLYRVNSKHYTITALVAHIMNFTSLWNYPTFFDYSDRVRSLNAYENWNWTVNVWYTYRQDYGCIYQSLNTTTHTRIYNCSNQLFDCSAVTQCSNYAGNQRACDYDPCNLDCNGNCQSSSMCQLTSAYWDITE